MTDADELRYIIGETPWSVAQSMIGRSVKVVMDRENAEASAVRGELVSLNMYGEFVIDTPEGRRYCWPFCNAVTL